MIERRDCRGFASLVRLSELGGHFLLAAALVSAALPSQVWSKSNQAAETATFLQGKLDAAAGQAKITTPGGGAVTLSSENPSLAQTLQDIRLRGREVRLEGQRKPDGSFEVRHLFTVKDGKLFRVRYYCHVCNIPATEPGNCVCCQRPTEVDEIPADQVTDDMVMVP